MQYNPKSEGLLTLIFFFTTKRQRVLRTTCKTQLSNQILILPLRKRELWQHASYEYILDSSSSLKQVAMKTMHLGKKSSLTKLLVERVLCGKWKTLVSLDHLHIITMYLWTLIKKTNSWKGPKHSLCHGRTLPSTYVGLWSYDCSEVHNKHGPRIWFPWWFSLLLG